jgi:DNA-binding GntR family transcriptional regulator
MLVADGLLVRGRGRSAEVRSFTAEDAVDLYRLRRPIEETAVSLVIAGRRGLDGVQSSADAFTGMPEGVSWDVVASHDIAFHRAVLVAAGSPRLLRTFDEAGAELRLLIAQLRPAYASVSELAAEHASLLAVLRSGDTVRAQSAWTEHFDDAERFFLTLIQERAR